MINFIFLPANFYLYNNLMNILPITIDEFIAFAALVVGLVFSSNPLLNGLAGVAIVYLFICIAFRKYEAVQYRLRNKK